MKKIFLAIITVAASAIAAFAQDSAMVDVNNAPAIEAPETGDLQNATEPVSLPTPDGEALAQKADSAYAADNFDLAVQCYHQAIVAGGTSTTLFYNLGNAYYRTGNLGKAIVNYERALKLDPTNSDARTNLEFVQGRIADKQFEEGNILSTMWDSTVEAFRSNTWGWLSLVLFALFLLGVAGYVFAGPVWLKKTCFFGGFLALAFGIVSVIISLNAASRVLDNSHAVIISPAAQLSTSPREARTPAEEAFLLHEGTKVEVVDSISSSTDGNWYEVKVGNSRAWIKASDVERI